MQPKPRLTVHDTTAFAGRLKAGPVSARRRVATTDGFITRQPVARPTTIVRQSSRPVRPNPVRAQSPSADVQSKVPESVSSVVPLVIAATTTPDTGRRWSRPKFTASPKSLALYATAVFLFAVGMTVSINGLQTNRKVAAQVNTLASHATDSSPDSDKPAPPSTTKPSESAVRSYVVAPNLPRYIDVVKLGVHARVLSMGVNAKNQLQAPGNVYDAGWYNASAQPGQAGAMLVDGHISSWTTRGVFYGLNKLVVGDAIVVTRGDGKQFTYKVVKRETVSASSVDMSSLLVSQNTAKPGLNLISCSGEVIPGTNEFDKRIIVYAVAD